MALLWTIWVGEPELVIAGVSIETETVRCTWTDGPANFTNYSVAFPWQGLGGNQFATFKVIPQTTTPPRLVPESVPDPSTMLLLGAGLVGLLGLRKKSRN